MFQTPVARIPKNHQRTRRYRPHLMHSVEAHFYEGKANHSVVMTCCWLAESGEACCPHFRQHSTQKEQSAIAHASGLPRRSNHLTPPKRFDKLRPSALR